MRFEKISIALGIALSLAGCGGDSGGAGSTPTPTSYTLGGTISGLTGVGLTLRNGSETITIAAGATSFAFASTLLTGTSYSITVGTQPDRPTQTCTVTNANGTVASANITNAAIACKTDPEVFVYVLRGSSSILDMGTITTLALDAENNALAPVGAPISITCLTSVTANHQNRLIFTTRSQIGAPFGKPCEATFRAVPLDPTTGTPNLEGSVVYSDTAYPTQAIIHPNGIDFYILRANASESVVVDPVGAVAPYKFDATGIGATASGLAVALGTAPRSAAIDRSATRLIVTDQGSFFAPEGAAPGDVRVLDITNPQQPAALSTYAAIREPYAIVSNPAASYVYVSSLSGSIGYVLSLNTAGVLLPVGDGTFPTPGGVRSMAISTSGQTLYAVGYDSGTVQAYTIGSDGVPKTLGAALATGSLPVSVTVDPSGRYVMVLNQGSGNSSVSLYTVGNDGALTAAVGSPFGIGESRASGLVVAKLR